MKNILLLYLVINSSLHLISSSSIKTRVTQKTTGSNTSRPYKKPWETNLEEETAKPISDSVKTSGNSGIKGSLDDGIRNSTLAADDQFSKFSNETFQNGDDDNFAVRQYPQITKCTCYFRESCGCTCNQALTWEEFQLLPQNFVSCPAFTLSLRWGQFPSFPSSYFYNVGDVNDFALDISRIRFEYLLEPAGDSSSFHGVSFDTSAFIRIHQVSVTREWNWGGFYDLIPTRPLAYCEIQLVESTVPILTMDFGLVCQGAVIAVSVNSCGMMALEDTVFQPFYKLNSVDLSNNRLRVMLRSYFSYPANELEIINLAYNDIRSFPNNMFRGMPSLAKVDLRGNPIEVLEETTFRPIFRRVHIAGIETLPLVCDCRAKWMKEPSQLCGINVYGLAGAICESPGRLEGYSFFNDTLSRDLVC